MPFLECISIDTCMFLHMTCLSSWYVYTRAMLNEERKIVSKYCVGWPACCSQQMGEDRREDLKGLFCVRHNACRVMHAFNCFMFTLHAQLYMPLPACLTSIGVRTTDRPL